MLRSLAHNLCRGPRIVRVLWVLCAVTFFTGCNHGRLFEITPDASGHTTYTAYSDIYDTRHIFIPQTLGIQVMMQDQKVAGPWYFLKERLGTLGPEDFYAPSEAFVLLLNRRAEPLQVRIVALRLYKENVLPAPITWDLLAKKTKSVRIPHLKIPSYEKELECEIELAVDGQTVSYPLTLRRLTEPEADQLFNVWSKRDKNVDEFFPQQP